MRISLLLLLSFCVFFAHAAELTVSVSTAPESGSLVFQVYDSATSFGDFREPAVEKRIASFGAGEYQLDGLPDGNVAVLVFFDVNENGILDKNFIGVPTEPIGFPNGYKPKGPPSFQRATVATSPGSGLPIDIELSKVIGERGNVGAGVGVIGQSSPYVGANSSVLRAIPAITYNGERLQWLGPNVQYGIMGSGKARLALSASYRISAYEEDDSPALAGLGDRDSTLMAGLGLRYELPGGANLLVRYEHDVLDRIGGGAAKVRLSKAMQAGVFRLSPQVSVNWQSTDLTNHDFGVPAAATLPGRPAYTPGSSISYAAGIGSFIELSESWRVVFNVSIDLLDDSIKGSPIVDTNHIVRGFAAISYVF